MVDDNIDDETIIIEPEELPEDLPEPEPEPIEIEEDLPEV